MHCTTQMGGGGGERGDGVNGRGKRGDGRDESG